MTNNRSVEERTDLLASSLREHLSVMQDLLSDSLPAIEQAGEMICRALREDRQILLCGNGGSAADAQHIAAELVGRYERQRRALRAVALTTDTSALTALGNDYGFEEIFSRQVDALARPSDLLIAISTSGNSPNILKAAEAARAVNCRTLALTGGDGGQLAKLCEMALIIPAARTSRIQEAHITIAHLWCEMIDAELSET